ncbi:MAG TPA: chemotaxis protein CheW [Frankiaceae bacterium]|jgi:chemotaxis signal transduction protein|nr:chemotaxis protein CheW [Frankiaceae bacterium]
MRVLAFHAAGERYLVRLDAVRAVVRLRGLRRLPGSVGPMSGVLDVQENPVAIYETRPRVIGEQDSGDVLVLAAGWPEHAVGVACDGVDGLLELDDDPASEAGAPRLEALPGYVEALLRVDGAMVPLVDVVGLAEATQHLGSS